MRELAAIGRFCSNENAVKPCAAANVGIVAVAIGFRARFDLDFSEEGDRTGPSSVSLDVPMTMRLPNGIAADDRPSSLRSGCRSPLNAGSLVF